MKINSIQNYQNYNQSFKAKFSPEAEAYIREIGRSIMLSPKSKTALKEFENNVKQIKKHLPNATITIKQEPIERSVFINAKKTNDFYTANFTLPEYHFVVEQKGKVDKVINGSLSSYKEIPFLGAIDINTLPKSDAHMLDILKKELKAIECENKIMQTNPEEQEIQKHLDKLFA